MSHAFDLVEKRAQLLAAVRSFFQSKNVIEVDCTHLLCYPQIDANIEVMLVEISEGQRRYLHTSPEYEMKKLLASICKDIYQLSKVYRKGEEGSKHFPEFTMLEWYRIGFSLNQMIEETIELTQIFTGPKNFTHTSYRDVFLSHLNIDPLLIEDRLLEAEVFSRTSIRHLSRDEGLDLLFSHYIAPELESVVVFDFPPSQAALSEVQENVAKRFEIFLEGEEVANGYLELRSEIEHRNRFAKQNELRKSKGKTVYPIDESFLAVVEKIPPCCGVAVGFDRLMMLHLQKKKLSEVLINSIFAQSANSDPC